MFVNFANVLQTSRKKPPFGIAQIGKAFRNEITPGNFVFRTREFEQMEMEFFVPPERDAAVVRVLVQRALQLVRRRSASRPTCCACGPTTPTSCRHYSSGHDRRRVPLPVRLGRAGGHRQPQRLRPHPARQALGREARLLRPGDERALRAVRDRAGGRRRPDDDGVPARRLRRGRGQRRGAHRAAPAPPPGAVQGGGAPAVEEGDADSRSPARCCRRCSRPVHVRLRRDADHRPALPAPGRDRHARSA